jgi:hypothetical protein
MPRRNLAAETRRLLTRPTNLCSNIINMPHVDRSHPLDIDQWISQKRKEK